MPSFDSVTAKGILEQLQSMLGLVYDGNTFSMKTEDVGDYYICQGHRFGYSEKFTIGAGGNKCISFKTPTASGHSIHYIPNIIACSADKLTIQLFEGDVISGGSNVLASVFNYNRQSSNATEMQSFLTGTTQSTPGTSILSRFIGGGTGVANTESGGSTSEREKRVLKVDTIYTLKLTNDSENSNIINVQFSWIENGC